MWKGMTAFAILISVLLIGALIVFNYQIGRDTDALIDRAQVAANAEDMLEYVTQLEQNMQRIGMTSGHTALIFTTPANDMALHFKTVQRIAARLEQIKALPQDSTAYQVGLDDLRGTLRELSNPGDGWTWVTYGWWMLLIGVIIWIITGIAFFREEM